LSLEKPDPHFKRLLRIGRLDAAGIRPFYCPML
jgi:hypothetical protein